MLTKGMLEGLNEQIKHEFASAYIYLAMSAFCQAQGLPGCARWLRLQSREEVTHALKFFDFIHDRGGQVLLRAIEQPPAEYRSPMDVFQHALDHERKVTGLIHQLYALAVQDNDYATQAMLHWFLTEQIEEEKTAAEIVQQFKMAGEGGSALLMLDQRLGARSGE